MAKMANSKSSKAAPAAAKAKPKPKAAPATAPKKKAGAAAPKKKVAAAAPRKKAAAAAPKKRVTAAAPKKKVTAAAPKKKVTAAAPKKRVTAAAPKKMVAAAAPKKKAAAAAAPKKNVTAAAPKAAAPKAAAPKAAAPKAAAPKAAAPKEKPTSKPAPAPAPELPAAPKPKVGPPAQLAVGAKAPSFSLLDQNGEKVTLGGLAGRWVILYAYPRDDTPGCTLESLEFTARLPEFQQLGATVLGISPDSVASHEKFCAKHELEVTLLADPEHDVLASYGFYGKKVLYGKESEGVIRSTVIIDPKGKIAHRWPTVKVEGHAEEVLIMLEDLAD